MVLEKIFNPVLVPLLRLDPALAIAILSFVISVFVTLIYKFITNQELMKSLKDDMKTHQKEMKEHRQNPEKMMEIQKKAMEKNMQYMMQSFKPMIVTLLPLLLVFGWLNAHMAYEPILPGQGFTTTAVFEKGTEGSAVLIAPEGVSIIGNATQEIKDGRADWTLKGKEGVYAIEYQFEDKSATREVLITKGKEYKPPVYNPKEKGFKSLNINNTPKKILNIFGLKLSWLWTYIIFSMIFSMGLRKVLKIY